MHVSAVQQKQKMKQIMILIEQSLEGGPTCLTMLTNGLMKKSAYFLNSISAARREISISILIMMKFIDSNGFMVTGVV